MYLLIFGRFKKNIYKCLINKPQMCLKISNKNMFLDLYSFKTFTVNNAYDFDAG